MTSQIRSSAADYTTQALFDTDRYPIHDRGSAAYAALLTSVRQDMAGACCARLEGFVRPDVLAQMQHEATALAPHAVYTRARVNPYFTEPDASLPDGHPRNRLSDRTHGMVRGDSFEESGVIWAAFQSVDLCAFVADALGYQRLYTYRDPYSCLNVNIQPVGSEFAWHFDNNDFTISIGLRQSRVGGTFEYVPDLRTDQDESYDAVRGVLDGDRDRVRAFQLNPGDLQLFLGGYTLHRVTAPADCERQSLLLSYVTNPSKILSAEKAIRLWGEAHPMHCQADESHPSSQPGVCVSNHNHRSAGGNRV